MTSKKEMAEMLRQSVETNNKLTKHIEALWQEIGEKQSRIYDLNYEISELDEKKDSSKKEDLIERAQFQKDWLENHNHRKVDN